MMAWCKSCKAERRKPGIHAERERAADMASRGLKKCGACDETKPLSMFNARRASLDGLCHKCRDCSRAALASWRRNNPDGFRDWCAQNAERRAESWRRWYGSNKSRRAKSYADWAAANSHVVNAVKARRYAAKKHAAVSWANKNAISAVYAEAARLTRETGVRHEVDHVVPLQSPVVCGLHWEGNLQVLTKIENLKKRNKLLIARG